jgi:hypothetical protein
MGDPKNHAIKSIRHFYSRRWRPSRQTALTGGPGNELSILWVKSPSMAVKRGISIRKVVTKPSTVSWSVQRIVRRRT